MKPSLFRLAVCGLVLFCGAWAAHAELPRRDVSVEIRQVEEGREDGKTYSAGSAGTNASGSNAWEPQLVQVRNGEKATLRVNDAVPMQWLQSASIEIDRNRQGSSGSNGGSASGPSTSSANSSKVGSVSNQLVWFDAGQSLTVRPQWPGGSRPAVVELEVQKAAVDARVGADLPTQSRSTVSTTVTTPLGQWVTVAATGKLPSSGSYSSESAQQVRRLLQIRVLAP
jgi:hypothetical protein